MGTDLVPRYARSHDATARAWRRDVGWPPGRRQRKRGLVRESVADDTVQSAEQVFDAPTRVGYLEPSNFGGLIDEVQAPYWSVASGLALASMRSQLRHDSHGDKSSARRVAEWFGTFREKFR